MRPTLQPRSLHAFEALAACPEGAAVDDRIKVAVAGVNALDIKINDYYY